MKKKKLIYAILPVLLIVIYFAVFRDTDIVFDKTVWMKSSQCNPLDESQKRLRMVKDLATNHLKNKDYQEIVGMLGPSEPAETMSGAARSLIYCLGPASGKKMNWLVIHMHSDGMFESSEILKEK